MLFRLTQRRKHWLVFAVLTGLAFSTWPTSARADGNLQQQLQEAQQQQSGLSNHLQQAQGELDDVHVELQKIQDQLAIAQGEHERLFAEFQRFNAQKQAAEKAVQRAETELQTVTEQLKEQKGLLGNRLKALQEKGQVSYLEMLFQSVSMQDLLGRWDLLASIVKHDNAILKGVQTTMAAVEVQRKELVSQRDQVADMTQQAAARSDEAAARQAEVAKLQASFESKKADDVAKIQSLEQQSKRLAGVVHELEQQVARQVSSLGFRFPVDRVTVTDDYGPRWHPILNQAAFHYGVDFAVDTGAPVYAAEGGVVLVSGDQDAFGLAVIISHGELRGHKVSSLYGHNSELLVWPGKTVQKGDIIARAGSTGWSTGPHCHFGVYLDGTPTNPWDWLPSR